jgi:hypothetical protein
LIGLILGSAGAGGLITYWVKSRIDAGLQEKEWKRKYLFDDLKRQHDLLVEFLGRFCSDFTILLNVGHTWDEQWRRDKARPISEWVQQYRPLFPEEIQHALTFISNLAGTSSVAELGSVLPGADPFADADRRIEQIRRYAHELEQELTGKVKI